MNTIPMQMKPMIHLTSKDLPDIKKWKIGGKYKVTMALKQTSMSEDDMGYHASFELIKAKPEKEESYETEAVKTAIKGKY